ASELGQGVARAQEFAEFRALVSVQGLAVVPTADRVTVRLLPDGAEIGREGGLALSSDFDRKAARQGQQRLFDLAAWGAGGEDPVIRRRALQAAVAAVPANARTAPRLALARFFFAE